MVEIPIGPLDGANREFTLSRAPKTERLVLSLNGVIQKLGYDYSLSGNIITYAVAPFPDDWHEAEMEANANYVS